MSLFEIKSVSIIEIATKLGIKVIRKKAECYNGHDTRTPSLSFDDKKGLFYCFGCGEGGDQIDLVKNVLNLNFSQSCRWIEEQFNLITVSEKQKHYYLKKNKINRSRKITPDNPFKPNAAIYKWLLDNLNLSNEGKDYLINSRGFSEQTIDSFKIKDITNVEIISSSLLRKWGRQSTIECGLFKTDEKNSKMRLVWWDHTIVFPFFNQNHQIDYLQGRRLKESEPKYVNLKGVSPTIFNLHSLNGIKQGEKIFICEGVTDALSATQLGWNAVGILGFY
ncbi:MULTISPECIES: CHC2 zinc finger domain-containing protein [Flavobacteriaceae]|uniref:CHC2 zinc finger domain-containing protein n=1 Tax=Flavobacteriaceae TaxID=49546 RepID=UPI0023491141|nr:CHC2 zinc finger domain-containing protein [Muricauda sp. SP22]MDC6362149.1 CHC2 zinc finger domain-containing protein [Muricauda sp. SP22]